MKVGRGRRIGDENDPGLDGEAGVSEGETAASPLASWLLGRWRKTVDLLPTRAKEHEGIYGGIHVGGNGIITLPDGQLRAVIRAQGINLDSLTDSSKNKLAFDFSMLVSALQPEQQIQILIESRPSSVKEVLPDLLAPLKARNREERRFIRHYGAWLRDTIRRSHLPDLRFYLILAPPPARSIMGGKATRVSRETVLRQLEQVIDDVSNHLKAMEIPHQVLGQAEALRVMWDGLHHSTGEKCPPLEKFALTEDEPSELTEAERAQAAGYFLQNSLFDLEVEERVDHVRVNGRYAASTYLISPPEVSWAGFFESLVGLEFPFRLSYHLVGLAKASERRRLKTRRRALAQISRSTLAKGGVVDVDAQAAEEEVHTLALETLQPSVSIARLGLYLTVFADSKDDMERRSERVRSLLSGQMGAQVAFARGHQLPLWRSNLPFCVDHAKRCYRVVSQTVGDAVPFMTHNPGTAKGMFLGLTPKGREMVRFDPADPSLPTSLMNIVGRSGSGKTFLANKIMLYTLLSGGRATVVDRAGHYEIIKQIFGGQSVSMARRDAPSINPWDLPSLEGLSERERAEKLSEKITFVMELHEVLLGQADTPLSRLEKGLLETGIRAVYARHLAAGTVPLERHLYDWFGEALADPAKDEEERKCYRELHVGLRSFVYEGSAAFMIDRVTTVDLGARLLIFDMKGLSGSLTATAMFMITEAVNRRANRERPLDEDRTVMRELLVIDEGWYLIKYANASAWLEELARRGRHIGLFLLFISQQISDLLINETAVALFNAASVQFIFRQNDAGGKDGKDEAERLAGTLRLTKREGHAITRLTTRPGAYAEVYLLRESKYEGQLKRGIVRVMPQPHEYWMFTSDSTRDKPWQAAMIRACGGHVLWAICRLAARRGLPAPGEYDDEEAYRGDEDPLVA
ncbi:MAG TPA: hypothetical protein VNL71_13595 [Chloroflexota bacterium]|nr:hypothetical protein [Chloroflexota bacterium]